MIDPYRMVVVNIFFVLILGLSLVIYRFIFPRKKLKLLPILIFISLMPLISILRDGSYESGDLSLHTKFAMQFFDNLLQGNLIPRWIQNHCSDGYGCPTYIFLFQLPYYLISLFHIIGFSFLASTKILIALTFIFSGLGMYWWMKSELGDKPGFVAAIFYLFAPYHLIDLHFRVSIGELVAFAIIPFIFLSIKKLIETKNTTFFLITSILFALLILSHQVASFVFLYLFILYGIYVTLQIKQGRYYRIFLTLASLMVGVMLTAYYWIPVLTEVQFIRYGLLNEINFHTLSSFLYSQNRFGLLFQGHMGELYFNIGYVQWAVIALSFYLIIKNKIKGKEKILLWGCLSLFVIIFLLMQEISKPIWQLSSILEGFQFSWRLSIVTSLLTAIIAGIVIKRYPKNIFIIFLCSLAILYTILNWGNRRTIPLYDDVLRSQKLFEEAPGSVDFTTPIWVDINKPWIGEYPNKNIQLLSGSADIDTTNILITKHEYVINVKKDSIIKENTFYYPGWKVIANNEEVPIIINNPNYPGVITFKLNKGIYNVKVIFEDTKVRKYSKLVSLFTFIILIIYFIYSNIFKLKYINIKRSGKKS